MRPCIRSATLDGYVELARSRGLDPARQAAHVGLDLADLAVPNRWIPAAAAGWLLELSAADSGCEDFALQLSEYRRLATLGPLSVVLREEPDLHSVVDLLIRYERSYNEAIRVRLIEGDEVATLQIQLDAGEPVPTRQGLDLAVAALLGILRRVTGEGWQPRAVCFSHRRPERLTTYRRLLGPRLQFGQDFTGLLIPREDLFRRNVLADPLLQPYREQLLLAVPAPRTITLGDRVRELVEALLPIGRCSMRQVARGLGLAPRTLRRRLEAEDETFSAIVDDTRTALAERYLADDRLSLTDVAYALGFAAPSAFSRWFRHRFDTSPTEWRRAARDVGGDSRFTAA